MRGLGRLFALPWLLIALIAQSLAPAEAAAMRPDSAGMGVCSAAHTLGGAHRPDPAKGDDHDCCAFACALVGLGAAPPAPAHFAPARLEAPAELASAARESGVSPSPVDRPRSRGPPQAILTN